MSKEELIKNELIKTTKNTNYNGWDNKRTTYGYHSYDIDELYIEGQRNPKLRLNHIRKYIDLTGKVVYDFGCNVGAMLHHMPEIKKGVGFDYDNYCIKVGNNISKILGTNQINLIRHDFDIDDYEKLRYQLINSIDVSLLLSIGSWVRTWNNLYTLVNNHSKLIVLETNNDKEGKPQIDLFKGLGRKVTLISNKSDDDITGNNGRKTYIIE